MFNSSLGREEVIDYRISKVTAFEEDEHPLMGAVHRRVRDITSLDTKSADTIQVINYGIGGHFEPHFDYFNVRKFIIIFLCQENEDKRFSARRTLMFTPRT